MFSTGYQLHPARSYFNLFKDLRSAPPTRLVQMKQSRQNPAKQKIGNVSMFSTVYQLYPANRYTMISMTYQEHPAEMRGALAILLILLNYAGMRGDIRNPLKSLKIRARGVCVFWARGVASIPLKLLKTRGAGCGALYLRYRRGAMRRAPSEGS
jgi:hypothetical protein